MAKDPVCGMEVSEEGVQFLVHVEHKNYYFCSEACKRTFEEQIGLTRPEVSEGDGRDFWDGLPVAPKRSSAGNRPSAVKKAV